MAEEVFAICKLDSWSSVWTIAALANVLHISIDSLPCGKWSRGRRGSNQQSMLSPNGPKLQQEDLHYVDSSEEEI